MQELDTSDEGVHPGRHRAPRSAVRRLSLRLGIAALGVLVAAGLGVGCADLLGLSDAVEVAAEASLPRGVAQAREEEPRPWRSTARPAVGTPQPEDPPVDPAPEPPTAAVPPEPAARPSPAPRAPAAAPVRTVRTGGSCAAVGQTATTTHGGIAVCTASRGNGPNKWRAA